jgi:hypothetical protein
MRYVKDAMLLVGIVMVTPLLLIAFPVALAVMALRRLSWGRERRSWPGAMPVGPLPVSIFALELPQHVAGADQMVVEDLTRGVQQRPDQRIPHRVADAHPFLPA